MNKISCALLWSVLLALHNAGWADIGVAEQKDQPEWRVISGDLDKVLGSGETADTPKVEVPLPPVAQQPAKPQPTTAELPGKARTGAEKEDELERKIDDSFAVFESVILREKEYVRNKEAENPAGIGDDEAGEGDGAGSGGNGDGGIGGEGDEYDENYGGQPEVAGASDAENGRGEESSEGSSDGGEQTASRGGQGQTERDETESSQGGSGGASDAVEEEVAARQEIPDDLKDASSDDKTARDLRRAAMRETDPELRAILWEALRQYKQENG